MYTTQINCSIGQPLQNLVNRLSLKSSQLYIFWQNYNQLYNLYHQKSHQVTRLRDQIALLRKQSLAPKVQMVQDTFLKERYLNLERNFQESKLENQRLKNECKELRIQTSRFYQQNLQLQALLQQLRQQNNLQKQSIQRILNQLKSAQNQLTTYSKLYEQVQHKQILIKNFQQNQKRFNQIILQREQQIQYLIESSRDMKIHYENLLRQSMQNAKIKVIQSFPTLIKTSKQKIQVISN